MNMQEEPFHFTPTVFQSAMGDPLRSEQRTGEILPRVLSRVDLLILFIAVVVFIPDAAVVQTTQTAGASTYLYWVVGTLTFLLPGAIVTGQLNHFMPADGSIYVWSQRALGSLWGFFAGFCAWFPGVLVLLTAGDFIRSLIQGIGMEIASANTNWLSEPWQQGVLILVVLLLAGGLSVSPDLRRSFLDKACRACDELVLLQANIMDASRIEFDAATLDPGNIALKGICTAVVDLFEPWILKTKTRDGMVYNIAVENSFFSPIVA